MIKMEPIIQINNIYKSFGAVEAIKGVSLSVNRGEVVMLSLIHISEPTRPY